MADDGPAEHSLFICIPFIPGISSIPRWIPIYRLIWREHYRSTPSA